MAEFDAARRPRWAGVLARAAVLAGVLLAAACVPVDDGYGGGYSGYSGYGYGGGYSGYGYGGGPVYSRGYDGRSNRGRDYRGSRDDHNRGQYQGGNRGQYQGGNRGRDRDTRGQQQRSPASGPSPRTFWNVPPGGSPGFGGPSNPGIN